MSNLSIDELLPLIPAFSILLVLILVFSIYKLKTHLKHGKRLDQMEHDLEEDDKHVKISIAPKSKATPLVVPSSNKMQSAGLKNDVGKKPDLLDDDPQDKPLFPSETVSAPLASGDKSCEDLYRELLDSDRIEDEIYQDLLGSSDTTNQPKFIPSTPPQTGTTTAPGKSNNELASETLLSEIEKELIGLERDLQASPEPGTSAKPTGEPINDAANDREWKNAFVLSQEESAAPTLDNLFDADMFEDFPELKGNIEDADINLSSSLENREPKIQETQSLSNDLENTPPADWQKMLDLITPISPASGKSSQYVNRLKSFQSNLERRFSSPATASAGEGKKYFDHAMVGRAQPATKHETKRSDSEKNALELLESFLFTANQRRASQ